MTMKSLAGGRPRLPGRLKTMQEPVDSEATSQSPVSATQCSPASSFQLLAIIDNAEGSKEHEDTCDRPEDSSSTDAAETPGHGADIERVKRAVEILVHSNGFRRCAALQSLLHPDENPLSEADCSDDSLADAALGNEEVDKTTLTAASNDTVELRGLAALNSVSDQGKRSEATVSAGELSASQDEFDEFLGGTPEERSIPSSPLESQEELLALGSTELPECSETRALRTSLQELHLTDADIDTLCQEMCPDFTQDDVSAAAAEKQQKEFQAIDVDSLPPLSEVPFNWCIQPSYERSYSNPFVTAFYDRHYGIKDEQSEESSELPEGEETSNGTKPKKVTHKPRRPNTEHQGGQGNRISTTPATSLADRVQRLRVAHEESTIANASAGNVAKALGTGPDTATTESAVI